MTADDLKALGEAVFGPSWQTPLAAALGVNDRTVRRLAAGTHDIHAQMEIDILTALRKRADAADQAIRDYEKRRQ